MRIKYKTQISFCLLVTCFLLVPILVQGQVFIVKKYQSYAALPVKFLNKNGNDLSLQEVKKPSISVQFQNWQEDEFNLEIETYYWAKIELKNQLPQKKYPEDWVIKTAGLSHLEIYIQDEDGTFQKEINGRFSPLKNKEFAPTFEGNFIRFKLPFQQQKTIYFKGKSDRMRLPPDFCMTLEPLDLLYQKMQPVKRENALFIGFIMMMLVYNLISYLFGRHSSFLYYSGYLLALVIYDSFISGCAMDWLEMDFFLDNPKYYYCLKLVIYPGLMCYMAFISSVLDLKNLLPYWHNLYKNLVKLGALLIIVDIGITIWSNYSYAAADSVTVIYIFIFIIPNLLFLYPLYQVKSNLGNYIFIGIIAMNFGFLCTGITRLWTIDFSMTQFRIGTVLEILAFSLSLGYRQRVNEQAKQQSEFELEKSQLLKKQKEVEAYRLAELNEFKNRFFINITHEFRTPLTVIQGMAKQITSEKYQRETNLILESNQNLLKLVNQMLDLTKLEWGYMELQLVRGNIIDFLENEIENFALIAKKKQIQLITHCPDIFIEMDFDKEKMRQVISNLLSNALKFTEEKGQIEVEVVKKGVNQNPHLLLTIKDNGCGIGKADLPHIFDRFYQVTTAENAINLGSGIGLALTKELVNFMGGTIMVDSKLRIGTTFKIVLPIEVNTPNFADKNEAIKQDCAKKTSFNDLKSNILKPRKKPSILVIEDNPAIIEYLKDCLQNDYKLSIAENGKIGSEKAIAEQPDIILSDVAMPEMDGLTLTKQLKNNKQTSHIPIILLTARTTQSAKMQGLKSGADAYLYKPFDRSELLIRLEKLVESRRKIKQHFSMMQQLFPDVKTVKEEEKAFLLKLNQCIEEHLTDEKLTVVFLAEQMLLSRAQLFRNVKELTGESVQNYLGLIRLQHAKNLLETTNLNISEICLKVGISNISHFSKKFKKQFGYSPSKQRKSKI